MNWSAHLEGNSHDLIILADLFPAGEPTVGRVGDGYHVKSSRFENVADASEVKARAAKVLETMHGVARMHDGSYRPVKLGTQFTTDDGDLTSVILVDSIEAWSSLRGPMIRLDGEVRPPSPPQGPKYYALAESDPSVADAFRYFGLPPSWVTLYKVYEVISNDVGGQSTLVDRGWAPKTRISTFTESACRPEISGDEARHARLGGKASGWTMTIGEAQDFVRELSHAWADEKMASPSTLLGG